MYQLTADESQFLLKVSREIPCRNYLLRDHILLEDQYKNVEQIETVLNNTFRDKYLLATALYHTKSRCETKMKIRYEYLRFLGYAVIGNLFCVNFLFDQIVNVVRH